MADGLEKESILNIIEDSLKKTAEANDIAIDADISEKTQLYGKQGLLDSLALVGLVVSMEEKLSSLGYNVTIASEKAFSKEISPFLNVGALAKFIEDLLK